MPNLKACPLAWLPALAFVFALGTMTVGIQSCAAPCDATAVQLADDLTKSLPALIEKGTEEYSTHAAEVAKATQDLEAAHKRAMSSSKNKDLAEAYHILKTEIAVPYFAKWKGSKTVSSAFAKGTADAARASLKKISEAEKAKCKKK